MPIEQNALYKYHPHWILYLQVYLTGLILVVVGVAYRPLWPAAILGVLIFILGEVSRKAVTYYILDSGVARGYHFLSTSRKFAEYGSIQNVEVHQSFFENIIGIGSVKFDTSGSNLIEVNFHGVRKPYEVEKIVRSKMAAK